MSRKIQSIRGLFGQTIHFKDCVKVGETWDDLMSGTKKHYDADGKYVGSSTSGFFADEVHYDQYGSRISESWTDDFGTTHHYNDRGRVGTSYDGIIGTTSHIMDDGNTFFDQSEDSNPFMDDAPYGDPKW